MARRGVVRPGARWKPVAKGGRRVAGKLRPSLPRVRGFRLGVGWRRAGLATLVGLLLTAGGWWLYQSPLLSLRNVSVEGQTTLSEDVVRSVAGLEGESLLHPDFDGARERLLAVPIVKEAQIERDWPNGARIAIVERVPWGVWQVSDRSFVIDDEGVVIDVPPPEGAPVIVQTDGDAPVAAAGDRVDIGAVRVARRLVDEGERAIGRSVTALEFSPASGLTTVLTGGADGEALRVVFGDAQGYEFKLAALFEVLQQAQQEGRSLKRVDLRFGDRVAVQ